MSILLYVVFVVAYFFVTYHLFPLDVYHSLLNALIGFSFPVALFVIVGMIGNVLIRKGIIEPPPASSPADDHVPAPTQDKPALDEQRGQPEAQDPPAPAPVVPSPPRQPTVEEMLHSVDLMDGPGFERWCAQLFRLIGFPDVQLTKASGDQGVDIVAIKDDVRYAIQCKCYSSDIGNHSVQEVHAGKSMYGCHVGVVLTNRYFTSGAKELAKVTGILLWDRNKLKALIQEAQNKNKPGVA